MHADPELRVLFVTGFAHLPQRVGGSQSSTHDLCEQIARSGARPAVLAALSPGGLVAWRNRLARKLTGRRFPVDRSMGYPVFRGWRPEDGIPEVATTFHPDVAVVQAGRPVPLARGLVAAGVPVVVYVRDVAFERMGGELPDDPRVRYVANSRFTAERLLDHAGLEAVVLPPLVVPERYRTDPTGEVVLFVCPHPDKGAEVAFRLAEARPDVRFLFQESWALRPDLREQWIARARAAGNIEWQAPVPEMRSVFRRARLVLMPSLSEAWGRVATEAQVSGIPVLASNRGGLPESVGPGGILADPDGSLTPWLQGLATLWDDAAAHRRYAQAALAHAQREEIRPEVLARRFLQVLSDHLDDVTEIDASGCAP